MTVQFIYDGNPDHIPGVGAQIPLSQHTIFIVDGYVPAPSEEFEYPGLYPGHDIVCAFGLEGHILIPAGSPFDILEFLLGGK